MNLVNDRELLRLARSGDVKELAVQLELATRETHQTRQRGQQLSERQKLLDEALWYARHGDLSEAKYRLEQAA